MDANELPQVAEHLRLVVAQQVAAEMGRHGRMRGTDLARESGVKYRTLIRCLNGERPFTVDELARIAGVLNVDVHELLVDPKRDGGTVAARQPIHRYASILAFRAPSHATHQTHTAPLATPAPRLRAAA